jgi:hypothetical protein
LFQRSDLPAKGGNVVAGGDRGFLDHRQFPADLASAKPRNFRLQKSSNVGHDAILASPRIRLFYAEFGFFPNVGFSATGTGIDRRVDALGPGSIFPGDLWQSYDFAEGTIPATDIPG